MQKETNTVAADLKTKELLIYVADRLKDQPSYGSTLLNKALYFIDNISYLQTQKPISNLKYVKQDFGPTPLPSQFLPLRDSLIMNDEMEEIKTDFFGRVQKKYTNLRPPNTEYFTKDEIVLIDKTIASLFGHNATSISNFSHKFLAWTVANNMDELPLCSFMLTSKVPSDEDISWAKNEVAEYLKHN